MAQTVEGPSEHFPRIKGGRETSAYNAESGTESGLLLELYRLKGLYAKNHSTLEEPQSPKNSAPQTISNYSSLVENS